MSKIDLTKKLHRKTHSDKFFWKKTPDKNKEIPGR